MREIKLSGREMAVLKAIDQTSGTFGPELVTITHLEPQDLVDILSGLMDVGYVEAYAGDDQRLPLEEATLAAFNATRFEVNPSYALQIRQAMKR
jgi:DNA-binding MarR family transcriptional regulator